MANDFNTVYCSNKSLHVTAKKVQVRLSFNNDLDKSWGGVGASNSFAQVGIGV